MIEKGREVRMVGRILMFVWVVDVLSIVWK